MGVFGTNKKTNITGFGMIFAGIAEILTGMSGDGNVNWQLVLTSIIGGIGLVSAKDGNVTGGTVMQASSTQVLVEKAEETATPEAQRALGGMTPPSKEKIGG